MDEMTGRCSCGVVRWRASGPVLWAGHCHCDSCRRATSAPFNSFFGVPRNGLIWSGALQAVETSGGAVRRRFCAVCGTHMSYQNEIWPDEMHLYAATLDDPRHFVPAAHFHFAEALPWVQIADDLPRYPGSAETTEPVLP